MTELVHKYIYWHCSVILTHALCEPGNICKVNEFVAGILRVGVSSLQVVQPCIATGSIAPKSGPLGRRGWGMFQKLVHSIIKEYVRKKGFQPNISRVLSCISIDSVSQAI